MAAWVVAFQPQARQLAFVHRLVGQDPHGSILVPLAGGTANDQDTIPCERISAKPATSPAENRW